MRKVLLSLTLIGSFVFSLTQINAQTIDPGGCLNPTKYQDRLCSVRPDENRGTECTIIDPTGLCCDYRKCIY